MSTFSLAAEIVQGVLDGLVDACENGGVAEGVEAAFNATQVHHEVDEVGGIVSLEADDELLVIKAEGVGGVNLDGRVLVADGEMVVHHALSFFLRQQVPLSCFEEGIDDEVFGFAGAQAGAGAFLTEMRVRADILGAAGHGKVGVWLREVCAEVCGPEAGGAILNLFKRIHRLPEEEVGVAAQSDETEAAREHLLGDFS